MHISLCDVFLEMGASAHGLGVNIYLDNLKLVSAKFVIFLLRR